MLCHLKIQGRGLFPRSHSAIHTLWFCFVVPSHLCGGFPTQRPHGIRTPPGILDPGAWTTPHPQPTQRAWVSQGPGHPEPPAFSGRKHMFPAAPDKAGYSGGPQLKALSDGCWGLDRWLRV